MKIITTLAAVAGIAALSACGGGTEESTGETLEANTLVVDNVVTDMNMGMDANAMGDLDTMNMDMNATDMNMTVDNATTGNTTY